MLEVINKKTRTTSLTSSLGIDVIDVVFAFLLLTLNIFHTFTLSFVDFE